MDKKKEKWGKEEEAIELGADYLKGKDQDSSSSSSIFTINRKTLPLKLVLFLYCGGLYALLDTLIFFI